jgi:hypothetical protein
MRTLVIVIALLSPAVAAAGPADAFFARCVTPLAKGECPIMAAEVAGLRPMRPRLDVGPAGEAFALPGGGQMVIGPTQTGICQVLLPRGDFEMAKGALAAAIAEGRIPPEVSVRVDRRGRGLVYRAEAAPPAMDMSGR